MSILDLHFDLQHHLAACKPSYALRGFHFSAVLDQVERIAGRGHAAALARALPRRMMSFLNYPAADFLRLLFGAAEVVSTQVGGAGEALRLFGAATSHALAESTVGRPFRSFIRGNDPMQLLSHAWMPFQAALNFGERRAEPGGDRSGRLIFREDPLPVPYEEGILQSGFAAFGVHTDVRGTPTGPDSAVYLIRWD